MLSDRAECTRTPDGHGITDQLIMSYATARIAGLAKQ